MLIGIKDQIKWLMLFQVDTLCVWENEKAMMKLLADQYTITYESAYIVIIPYIQRIVIQWKAYH